MISKRNKISATSKFERKLKKLLKKSPKELEDAIVEVLAILSENPYSPSLNTHRVVMSGYKFVNSSRVTGDIRIIWVFSEQEVKVIYVLDIGGHSGGGSVY